MAPTARRSLAVAINRTVEPASVRVGAARNLIVSPPRRAVAALVSRAPCSGLLRPETTRPVIGSSPRRSVTEVVGGAASSDTLPSEAPQALIVSASENNASASNPSRRSRLKQVSGCRALFPNATRRLSRDHWPLSTHTDYRVRANNKDHVGCAAHQPDGVHFSTRPSPLSATHTFKFGSTARLIGETI
jgi:hypothetical protein